ncbi:hypothetical protein OQA88_4634 [Cercophora sp. LCS_1]
MDGELDADNGDSTQMSLESDSSEITALVARCKHHLSTVSSSNTESAPEARVQLARLNVWASNMGVFSAGRQSLVSRLSGSHETRKLILHQLVSLEATLCTMVAQYSPSLDDEASQSESESNVSDCSSTSSYRLAPQPAIADNGQGPSDDMRPWIEVRSAISRLHQFYLVVRSAGKAHVRERVQRFRALDRNKQVYDMFELVAREKADHLFPNAKIWLRARLAESISTRRARFAYIRQHQRKTSTLPTRAEPDTVQPENAGGGQNYPAIAIPLPALGDVCGDLGTGGMMAPSEILSATVKTKLVFDKLPQTSDGKPEKLHLTEAHNQKITANQLRTIIKHSQAPPKDIFRGNCDFCGGLPEELEQDFPDQHAQGAVDALEKHVRDHLLAFALLFLPVGLDEDDIPSNNDAPSSAVNGANSAATSEGSVAMPVSHCGRDGCDCYDAGIEEETPVTVSDVVGDLPAEGSSTSPVVPSGVSLNSSARHASSSHPLTILALAVSGLRYLEVNNSLLEEASRCLLGKYNSTTDIYDLLQSHSHLFDDMEQRFNDEDSRGGYLVQFRNACVGIHADSTSMLKRGLIGAQVEGKKPLFIFRYDANTYPEVRREIEELNSRMSQWRQHLCQALMLALWFNESDGLGDGGHQPATLTSILDGINTWANTLGASSRDVFEGSPRNKNNEPGMVTTPLPAETQKLPKDVYQTRSEAAESVSPVSNSAVLKNLWYPSLINREGRIRDRFSTTFEWIFDNSITPAVQELGPRHNFTQWLESDTNDLFWIAGKAGSGKSTLMKFIAKDPRLEQRLRVWAKGRKLVKACYFAWHPGSLMEKSLEGLLRSLLYQALSQMPELTPLVFPDWRSLIESYGNGAELPMPILDVLSTAFSSLLSFTRRPKLALLIDGVDQFEDPVKLVSLLNEWSQCGGVKICVSSRPWNVFSDAFRSNPNLRLELFTKHDIELFVRTQFENNPAYRELAAIRPENSAAQMAARIVEKAEGVLLWVVLVVSEIQRGLIEGENLNSLQHVVDILPHHLGDMYTEIFQRLDPRQRRQCSRYMQLLMFCVEHGTTLSSVACYFGVDSGMSDIPATDMSLLHGILRRQLRRTTGSLLELWPESPDDSGGTHVSPMHRTVLDWARQNETYINRFDGGTFDAAFAYLKGEVSNITLIRTPGTMPSQAVIRAIISAARKVEAQQSTQEVVQLLTRFDTHMTKMSTPAAAYWGQVLFEALSTPKSAGVSEALRQKLEPCTELTSFAALVCIPLYLDHIIKRNPGNLSTQAIRSLVLGELWFQSATHRIRIIGRLLDNDTKPFKQGELRAIVKECKVWVRQEDTDVPPGFMEFSDKVLGLFPPGQFKGLSGISRRVKDVFGRRP